VRQPLIRAAPTTVEPEQSFLKRQLDALLKDPNRDPRASFRNAAAVTAAASASAPASADGAGVVAPMGSGGLQLPGVERAMLEMEGGTAEDLKERFARLGRRVRVLGQVDNAVADGRNIQESSRGEARPLSPSATGSSGGTPAVANEALHNFVSSVGRAMGEADT
jgi:dynein light intermediate chain 1